MNCQPSVQVSQIFQLRVNECVWFLLLLLFHYFKTCPNALLGHTTSIFNPIRTGGLLNASSRVVLQETAVRFGAERCRAEPVPAAPQSRPQVEGREWHGGDTHPIARICTGTAQYQFLTLVARRILNAKKWILTKLELPEGKTQPGEHEFLVPLPEVAQACPVTRRGSTKMDG